jgi:hypothetical protein
MKLEEKKGRSVCSRTLVKTTCGEEVLVGGALCPQLERCSRIQLTPCCFCVVVANKSCFRKKVRSEVGGLRRVVSLPRFCRMPFECRIAAVVLGSLALPELAVTVVVVVVASHETCMSSKQESKYHRRCKRRAQTLCPVWPSGEKLVGRSLRCKRRRVENAVSQTSVSYD